MAVVLNSDEAAYFSSASLRRSHSQSHFGTAPSTSAFPSDLGDGYGDLAKTYSRSAPSSAASSPRLPAAGSTDLSPSSTPVSNFSLASEYDDGDDGYDSDAHYDQPPPPPLEPPDDDGLALPTPTPTPTPKQHNHHGLLIHPPSPSTVDSPSRPEPPPSPTPSPTTHSPDYGSSSGTPKPDTPECPEHAEDDSAVSTRPSRQVDYLSHEWREEDIWSSWRYITSRRAEYANSARLENASWRTWMKAKNKLSTVSPETLNWLKDCDVTWLYGPLQPGPNHMSPARSATSSAVLSKSGSAVNLNKKPILKKRSTSEVMLQRSLSTASLLKQAAAAVQAQETTRGILRPALVRAATDHTAYTFTSSMMTQVNTSSVEASTDSSSVASPGAEGRHIHFNEQVSQCIAVDMKGEGDEDDDDEAEDQVDSDESDSSDGIVMKRTRSRKSAPILRKRRKDRSKESKTIAMLPSTKLKYLDDVPNQSETAMKHSTCRSPVMSPSSSQETLRPSRSRGRFFFGGDDEDDDDDNVADGFCAPDDRWRSPPPELDGADAYHSGSSDSLTDEPAGMHRTPSGMLMPYGEADASARDGIFGRVVDTVNTARDIAHVIWNVGWRK